MSNVTNICREISELSVKAQVACNLFMAECKRCGIDVFITETYRSQERQDYLYSLGRTRSGNKVTWTKNSRHTSRRAWDIACNPPQQLYDTTILKACGKIAKGLNIIWGGDWNTPDYPHFEIKEDWTVPMKTEDEPMTKEEKERIDAIDNSLTNLYSIVQKLVNKYEENNKVYNTLDEIPEWAKSAVQKLIDEDKLHGDENGLNLKYDTLRAIVMLS